ncbi:MAG: DsrE/DsrF/DrsH-like family protein [Candidatus Thermoplasmatota archaeon]|jgi:peroxiredoxin family protein
MAAKKPASMAMAGPPVHKLSIIVSKGSLDMAYPPFILGNAAAIMGYEVHLFFTFWGMDVITKKRYGRLKATPVGNPAAHMPNLAGILPGATPMMTAMLRGKIKKLKIPPIPEMIASAKDLGVHLHACSTSMEMLGLTEEDFIPEVEDVVGAASFLGMSEGGQIIFI